MCRFDDSTMPRPGLRKRPFSWDRTGANTDSVVIEPGASHDLLNVAGAGVIRHVWLTVNTPWPERDGLFPGLPSA